MDGPEEEEGEGEKQEKKKESSRAQEGGVVQTWKDIQSFLM